MDHIFELFYKKKQHNKPPSKKKKGGKNQSPRNRKACHSISTALMQSITEIETQSTMKYEYGPYFKKIPTRKAVEATKQK
jgi:hypothetical protein